MANLKHNFSLSVNPQDQLIRSQVIDPVKKVSNHKVISNMLETLLINASYLKDANQMEAFRMNVSSAAKDFDDGYIRSDTYVTPFNPNGDFIKQYAEELSKEILFDYTAKNVFASILPVRLGVGSLSKSYVNVSDIWVESDDECPTIAIDPDGNACGPAAAFSKDQLTYNLKAFALHITYNQIIEYLGGPCNAVTAREAVNEIERILRSAFATYFNYSLMFGNPDTNPFEINGLDYQISTDNGAASYNDGLNVYFAGGTQAEKVSYESLELIIGYANTVYDATPEVIMSSPSMIAEIKKSFIKQGGNGCCVLDKTGITSVEMGGRSIRLIPNSIIPEEAVLDPITGLPTNNITSPVYLLQFEKDGIPVLYWDGVPGLQFLRKVDVDYNNCNLKRISLHTYGILVNRGNVNMKVLGLQTCNGGLTPIGNDCLDYIFDLPQVLLVP